MLLHGLRSAEWNGLFLIELARWYMLGSTLSGYD